MSYFSKPLRLGAAAFAVISAFGLQSGVAGAADFGGDCCADLEERIAELEATTVRKGNRKVSLFLYGEVSQGVLFWDDQAESNAYVLTNSTTKNKVGFEGQAKIDSEWTAGFRIELDLAIATSDFADQGDATFVTSLAPVTQSRFVGAGDDGTPVFRLRHANWFLKNERLGRLIVGQGSQATDGIAEIDLSGSSSVALSSVETWNETFFIRDENGFSPQLAGRANIGALLGNGAGIINNASPSFVADLFIGNLDGGRGNFVHYVSPTVAGFVVSAAWGEDDDWDVALRYAGEWGDFRVAGGVGYREGVTVDTETLVELRTSLELDQKALVASGSVIHNPTGLFLTMAGGHVEFDAVDVTSGGAVNGAVQLNDSSYIYAKGGIFRRFLPIGKTSIYGEYYRAFDVGLEIPGSTAVNTFVSQDELLEDSNVAGFGIVQHVDAAAMELYFAYRKYWADDLTDIAFQVNADGSINNFDFEYDAVFTGARIRF